MRTPYPFELPYTLSAWKVPYLARGIQSKGLWDDLTPALQTAIHDAWATRAPLEITQAALDHIPDERWNKLAAAIPAGLL